MLVELAAWRQREGAKRMAIPKGAEGDKLAARVMIPLFAAAGYGAFNLIYSGSGCKLFLYIRSVLRRHRSGSRVLRLVRQIAVAANSGQLEKPVGSLRFSTLPVLHLCNRVLGHLYVLPRRRTGRFDCLDCWWRLLDDI